MPDLIVVGSGLGGLCAAAIAARHGLEVLVLEAHSQPGGAAHQGYRADAARQSLSGLCIDLVQGKHGAHGGNHHGIVRARVRNRQASF
jgi:monoamine oxidase